MSVDMSGDGIEPALCGELHPTSREVSCQRPPAHEGPHTGERITHNGKIVATVTWPDNQQGGPEHVK